MSTSRPCLASMHAACRETRETCECAGCHLGPCVTCGADNLQRIYDGECASCVRKAAAARPFRGIACQTDPAHGKGYRDPSTRGNDILCTACHVAAGHTVKYTTPTAIAYCAGKDQADPAHTWFHIRGTKFGCPCGVTKFDQKARDEMRRADLDG